MEALTLVVSNPPHADVNLEAAAELLELDPFAMRLKANFTAPEIMSATGPEEAAEFAAALRSTGFTVSTLYGPVLADLPWPDPVSSLVFDTSHLQATCRNGVISVSYDAEVVGVHCRPPADRASRRSKTLDLERAVTSGHGPTIAEAIQWTSILDLYLRDAGSLRRVTIVPDSLRLDGERLLRDLRRLRRLRLDDRLAGVRPRAAFLMGAVNHDGPERRRYSFGTLLLRQVLESIAPELRAVPQYEFGSRLAYALSPLEASD
jgi:hypothetical protein